VLVQKKSTVLVLVLSVRLVLRLVVVVAAACRPVVLRTSLISYVLNADSGR